MERLLINFRNYDNLSDFQKYVISENNDDELNGKTIYKYNLYHDTYDIYSFETDSISVKSVLNVVIETNYSKTEIKNILLEIINDNCHAANSLAYENEFEY